MTARRASANAALAAQQPGKPKPPGNPPEPPDPDAPPPVDEPPAPTQPPDRDEPPPLQVRAAFGTASPDRPGRAGLRIRSAAFVPRSRDRSVIYL
jgi:hypothetical protein